MQAALLRSALKPASLNASISIVDGEHLIANNQGSDRELFSQFEQYIVKRYGENC